MISVVVAMSVAATMGEAGHAVMVMARGTGAALHSASLMVFVSITQGMSGIVSVPMLMNACGVAVLSGAERIGFA